MKTGRKSLPRGFPARWLFVFRYYRPAGYGDRMRVALAAALSASPWCDFEVSVGARCPPRQLLAEGGARHD